MTAPLTIPATASLHRHNSRVVNSDAIAQCRDELLGLMDRMHYTGRDLHAVALALTEALDNAFKHGRGRDEQVEVRVG